MVDAVAKVRAQLESRMRCYLSIDRLNVHHPPVP